MAKKDPTDLSVEERLKTLYQLQTTLSAIDEERALRGELPLEVQDLEDEIAGLTTRVEKIKNDIKDFEDAVRQKKAAGYRRPLNLTREMMNQKNGRPGKLWPAIFSVFSDDEPSKDGWRGAHPFTTLMGLPARYARTLSTVQSMIR